MGRFGTGAMLGFATTAACELAIVHTGRCGLDPSLRVLVTFLTFLFTLALAAWHETPARAGSLLAGGALGLSTSLQLAALVAFADCGAPLGGAFLELAWLLACALVVACDQRVVRVVDDAEYEQLPA
jgi:hypothetical protein